jgi:hypothetical protein
MRVFFIIFFGILLSLNSNAQIDSVKEETLAIKAIPFPVLYGILYGYGVVGYIEKSISTKSSIALGYKYLSYDFFSSRSGENNVLIAEYKHILSRSKNENTYLIPYLKYRNMRYSEQIESNVVGSYLEKSLGIGLTYGTNESLVKSNRLTVDMFGGLGYFFKLDKEGRKFGSMVGPGVVPYEPDFIIHGFDLRIGALFGFNFLK